MPSVLVVDDNSINRMLLTDMLERAGYGVRAAGGGIEALQMIDAAAPDVVLLDVQMPGMTGFEVCAVMKTRPRVANVPVIFISAVDEVAEKVKAFEAGGVDYVTKPFEPAEVLARVGTQVKLHRAQRELVERNAELRRRNEQLERAHERTERLFIALSSALTGTTLDDTYRIDEKIGEGGFGAVFRGVHLALQRPVAIKVLRPTPASDAHEQMMRFRTEGIAACRVVHPNAVEVFDFGVSSDGIAYLVMELLSGNTVGSLLRTTAKLPVQRCADIVAPLCDVLGAAHSAGIVHRDVKPDNVFLHRGNGDEVVKVLDFGIAKLLDVNEVDPVEAATRFGAIVGTPSYIAPERLLGRPYDERADIYSTGVLLYTMLSGALPFGEPATPGIGEMVRLHVAEKPRPIRDVSDDVPEAVAAVVMRAIDSDPAQRPPLREIGEVLRVAQAS